MAMLEELADLALREALRHGAEDVSVLSSLEDVSMVRFSNNSVTLVNTVSNIVLSLYAGKGGKRIVGSTTNPDEAKSFVERLLEACTTLQPSPDYTPLPRGPFQYTESPEPDRRIFEDSGLLVELTKEAIDSARVSGAQRVSGSLEASREETYLLTSAGAKAEDARAGTMINVRAFADANASGHGLSCSTDLSRFDPGGAGRTAGEYAMASLDQGSCEEGVYDILFTPTVAADIMSHIGSSASAFDVLSGSSFLTERLNERVAVEALSLRDDALVHDGLDGRVFDDEGMPTRQNTIIERGVLKTYLHNSWTARKLGAQSTGNAGFIDPHPWNLVVEPGGHSFGEMMKMVRKGLLITNNWYTRFQNLRTGEYSTLPRDASFLIENGEIKYAVAGIRISDSIPRQMMNIEALSKDRRWIQWWEVPIPTLCPAMLIKGVTVTKAVG